jgi:preprotein translocase subunit SecF
VLSQEQIETRRYQAKAQEAALNELRTRVARMTITAPVSGRVLQRGVQPGQIAGGGTTPWFTIARDGLVELDAEVNEADLAGIRVGQPAQVSLPGGQSVAGRRAPGQPARRQQQPPGQGARAPARPSDLRPGGFARASFGASGAAVTAVPESAIRYEADGLFVMTVDSNNRAHQAAVKVGQKGGGWAQLVQGPPAGTRVVLGGAAFVTDGDVIRPSATGRHPAGGALMATEQEKTGELRISAWAIKNPIPVAVLFIALIIAGIGCYLTLPIKQFPNVEFPSVSVTVTQSGAAPGEMETQVTRPIEDAVASISNVKTITSSVVQGASTTTIQFNLGEDLQKVTDEVRSKVDQTRSLLPKEVDEPIVQRLEITSAPIITYAVSAPNMSATELSWFIDDTVTRALQGEKGVAQVARVGGIDREINVVIDPDRMASFGVTAPQLNQALASFSVDAPGGRAKIGGREQTLRVLGAATTVEQLRQITIPITGGRYVKLTDVAQVGQGSEEERGFARLDGKPVVAFQVMKTRDSSDVAVEDNIKRAIDGMEAKHPGVSFVKIFSTVDETRASFAATEHTLLEGMLLASLVVFLFLREWRATLITAIAMPVSLIPTFAFMSIMGFSLNVVTLLALTLVIGILVDDAVVEIENIEKRVARGQRPFQAAMEGADAIGLAVVATTFTIVAVFVPVSYMPGTPGQFFKEFGLTVAVAVLFSLVVARLLTPLLAAYFLKPVEHAHPRREFKGFYRNVLDWSLDHRFLASSSAP